jgi:hypothetical protein
MNLPQQGGCLCGAVRFTLRSEPAVMGVCHCRDCQRASGASHCTQLAVPTAGVEMRCQTRAYDSLADSGNRVSRHFCPTCGGGTHSTNSAMPGMVFLRATHLDDPEQFRPMMEVYTASRPSWGGRFSVGASFERMPPAAQMPS